ncbi:MAG: hypothetical protein LBN93_10310 [Candidatus Symbiothrix sp.]|nr:hypothetical protein [Candidatus Symbiothrix sp.]
MLHRVFGNDNRDDYFHPVGDDSSVENGNHPLISGSYQPPQPPSRGRWLHTYGMQEVNGILRFLPSYHS